MHGGPIPVEADAVFQLSRLAPTDYKVPAHLFAPRNWIVLSSPPAGRLGMLEYISQIKLAIKCSSIYPSVSVSASKPCLESQSHLLLVVADVVVGTSF